MFRASVADVLISYLPRYILRPGILCTSAQCFGKVEESSRSDYHCKSSKGLLLSPKSEHYQNKKNLRGIKLSFIQLGGGIATGVYQQQKKFYSLTSTPEMQLRRNLSLGVWTITLQVFPIID